MACRCETGRCPSSRDALHIAIKNGSRSSRSSMHSFRIVVGMGSRLHDFDGERMITSRTSSSVHARKCESDMWRPWAESLAADDPSWRHEPTRPYRWKTWGIHQLWGWKEVQGWYQVKDLAHKIQNMPVGESCMNLSGWKINTRMLYDHSSR